MAVISVNTFLDGGAARTAGETWTLNGGDLTIRTDTRWYANAPAGMLGSLGAITISATLGGKVITDSSKVRWMAYNVGTGNVPAIGTTVSQGGTSGYLLGVWASETSAPSVVGGVMPASGFLKFREVTGAFTVGALTGIGAVSTEADRVGWIEVVHDQAIAITVPRLGEYVVNNDNVSRFYELGTTTGTTGQIIQIPTNGGGAGTLVPGIDIETGVGTGVYERFPAVSSTYFITANLGTDARSKFVLMSTNGQIRIGGDGTNAIGYLPPAGCKIRVPNVFQRNTTSTNRALNLVPNATLATRPDFTTTSAGAIRMNGVLSDWYFLFTAPYNVTLRDCVIMDIYTTSNEASPTILENVSTGVYTAALSTFTGLNNPLGGTVKNCKFYRPDAASNGHNWSMTGCSNYEFENVETGVITYARSTGSTVFSQCRNMIGLGTFRVTASAFSPSTSANFDFEQVQYIDRFVGTTNATTGKYAIATSVSCDNIIIRNVDFGGYVNLHPYLGIYNSSNCSNLTFRNAGTYLAPIGGATNAPAYIFVDGGNNDGVRIQNCFLTATRTGIYTTVNTSKNITFERLGGTVGAVVIAGVNTLSKGVRATSYSTTGQASVYGSHFFDMFNQNNTTGSIWLAFNEPTAFSSSQYEAVSLGTGAGFTSGGQIVMPNVGDEVIFTMPYFVKGHTGLGNIAPVITGTNTGNFTLTYAIDTGAGFGAYKTLNATNLSSEVITGDFKLKFRAVTSVANTGNALTYIQISTITTTLAQQNAIYPQDTASITLTGFTLGTHIQLYDVSASLEIYNGVPSSTTLSETFEYISDKTIRIRAMYQSGTNAKKWIEFTDTFTIDGLTRSITQENDTIYIANGINGEDVTDITINDSALLVESSLGAFTWQELYAYETYWLQTEEGIRDEARFIEAIDQANYKLFSFNIKNVVGIPLVISGGVGVDGITGEAIDVIDTSGGTIFCTPDRVVPFSTSGSVVISGDVADVWSYATRTLTSGGGGTTAEDIWEYPTRTITSGGITLGEIEASTVLAKESTVSSRASQTSVNAIPTNPLLASSYTAPDNVSITAIKAKTDTLVNTDLTGIATSTNITDAVTTITGEIDLVKINTDLIPATL